MIELTEPQVDLPLLRKAVDWANGEAAKPKEESEWDQSHWAIAGVEIERSCGTAYCIAGYVSQISGAEWHYTDGSYVRATPEETEAGLADGDGDVTVARRAQWLLGLTGEEADSLFHGQNTIERVNRLAGYIARRAGEDL